MIIGRKTFGRKDLESTGGMGKAQGRPQQMLWYSVGDETGRIDLQERRKS